jgi:hypothetical protein
MKGKKIMKKMILMAVALLSMTTATFAADENTTSTTAAAAYNLTNVNMSGLAKALKLDWDQEEAVDDIHKNFSADMMDAAAANKADRATLVDKAVKKDLRYMHAVLDTDQYHTYVMLLNATLNNRGLNK